MMTQFQGSEKLVVVQNLYFSKIKEYFNDTNLQNERFKFKIRTKILDKIHGIFLIKSILFKMALNVIYVKTT